MYREKHEVYIMSPHIPAFFRHRPIYGGRTINHTDIININVGGSHGCGGHVHHCGGGFGMSRTGAWAWGIGMFTTLLGGLLGRGSQTTVMQQPTMYMPGYNGYNMGFNAGLYTPGGYNMGFNAGLYGGGMQGGYNNGYNTGFNAGLYGQGNLGQLGAMQGIYGQQQAQLASRSNELTAMVKDLNNDYGFTFGQNEEVPQMSANGQQYTYKGKTFNTVTDLRNFIELQEGLVQARRTDDADETDDADDTDETVDTDVTDDTSTVHHEELEDDTDVDETVVTPPPSDTTEVDDDTETSPTHSGTTEVDDDAGAQRPDGRGSRTEGMTREQTEAMMAELKDTFGNVPSDVILNPDGTYDYGKYTNLSINALKYAVNAEKNYSSSPESQVSYNNFLNNDKDRMYTDGQLSLTKQQISNTETYGAFLLRNNKNTFVELGKHSAADFEKTFENMFEDNVKDAKQHITEQEFIKYHKDYELNAKDGFLKRDTERQKYNTVDMTAADEAHLKNLFYAMSKGTGKVTKQQYVQFMTDLFAQNSGKLTRAQLDDFCVSWLNKKD